MAFDEGLAQRVRELRGARVSEKKMFGGLCFLDRGNMAFGIVRDDESTGGTYVDGRRVGEPRALSERERVQVGRMLFRFRRV